MPCGLAAGSESTGFSPMKQPPSGALLVIVTDGKRALNGFIPEVKCFAWKWPWPLTLMTHWPTVVTCHYSNQEDTGKYNLTFTQKTRSPKYLGSYTNDNHMTHYGIWIKLSQSTWINVCRCPEDHGQVCTDFPKLIISIVETRDHRGLGSRGTPEYSVIIDVIFIICTKQKLNMKWPSEVYHLPPSLKRNTPWNFL